MAFDPSLIMKLAGIRNTFQKNHPKVVSFVQKELLTELPEGTIEIVGPDGKPIEING